MRTKRNLFMFALGGVAGYIVGRYPQESAEKARGLANTTADLARQQVDKVTGSTTLGRGGDHRTPTTQPPETGDDVVDRTATAYVAPPRP